MSSFLIMLSNFIKITSKSKDYKFGTYSWCKSQTLKRLHRLYSIILSNEDPRKLHFVTIRPHSQYLIGKYSSEFSLCDDENHPADVAIKIYKRCFDEIETDFILSIENNNDNFGLIHLHVVFINCTKKEFEFNLLKLKTWFDNPIYSSGRCIFPKIYHSSEKPFALAYYSGFDKQNLKSEKLSLKKSYLYSSYRYKGVFQKVKNDLIKFKICEKNLIKMSKNKLKKDIQCQCILVECEACRNSNSHDLD